MRQADEKLQKAGLTYQSGSVSPPSAIVPDTGGLYCFIPVTFRARIDGSRYLLKSSLLGISSDDGKTWKFLYTSQGEANIRKVVPEIPGALKFPAEVDPVPDPDVKK